MISVCMPYWERPAELERSLVAYKKVYGETMDLEFSICDDGSTHKPVVPRHDKRFIVTTLPRKLRAMNPCVPINRAVRASTGDVIVLTNPKGATLRLTGRQVGLQINADLSGLAISMR